MRKYYSGEHTKPTLQSEPTFLFQRFISVNEFDELTVILVFFIPQRASLFLIYQCQTKSKHSHTHSDLFLRIMDEWK